jgi:hypothetical protein
LYFARFALPLQLKYGQKHAKVETATTDNQAFRAGGRMADRHGATIDGTGTVGENQH